MKVTAFIGSGRKRHSFNACEIFLQNLQVQGDVEYELVRIRLFLPGEAESAEEVVRQGV
jgi:hypothetical protein